MYNHCFSHLLSENCKRIARAGQSGGTLDLGQACLRSVNPYSSTQSHVRYPWRNLLSEPPVLQSASTNWIYQGIPHQLV